MFGEKILEYWDDILKDLETLVAIPSVAVPTEGPHPFGDPCAKALDTAVELARGYGLTAKNVDYYAAHAEYGEGEGNAVVMAHLDVVPAGEGWATDPFTMVLDDNHAYGRGVSDNKGAAVVALHCLRALKDAGVKGNRKLRVIFRFRRGDRHAGHEALLFQGAAPRHGLHPRRGVRRVPLRKGRAELPGHRGERPLW